MSTGDKSLLIGEKSALVGQAIEFVEFIFACDSREAVTHLARNDTPTIVLVLFEGIVEAFELRQHRLGSRG